MPVEIPSLRSRIVAEWPWWVTAFVLLVLTVILLGDEIPLGELVTGAAAIVATLVGIYKVRVRGSPFR